MTTSAEDKAAWQRENPKRGRTYEDMGIVVDTPWKRRANSLAASSDPAVQKQINEGRRQMQADQHAMENWNNSGHQSMGGADE